MVTGAGGLALLAGLLVIWNITGVTQLSLLLKMIKESERTVVGFDLVEVCPSRVPGSAPIDASIGARVLYRLCGCV